MPDSLETLPSVAAPEGAATRYIHSDIFEQLVKSDAEETDLTGLLAYGIYQQRKREWISAHEAKHKCLPSESDVKNYSFGYQKDSLTALRGEADSMLFEFGQTIVEERTAMLAARAFNERTVNELGQLRGQLKKMTGYRHHIVGHVIGFVVLLLLTLLLVVGINHEPSIKEAVKWVIGRP